LTKAEDSEEVFAKSYPPPQFTLHGFDLLRPCASAPSWKKVAAAAYVAHYPWVLQVRARQEAWRSVLAAVQLVPSINEVHRIFDSAHEPAVYRDAHLQARQYLRTAMATLPGIADGQKRLWPPRKNDDDDDDDLGAEEASEALVAGGYVLDEGARRGVCGEVLIWQRRSQRFWAHSAEAVQKQLGVDLAASPSVRACELFADYLETGPGYLCGSAHFGFSSDRMVDVAGDSEQPIELQPQERVLRRRLERRQESRAVFPPFREAFTPTNMGLVSFVGLEGMPLNRGAYRSDREPLKGDERPSLGHGCSRLATLERQHTNELTLCFELDDEQRFADQFLPTCEVNIAKPRCTMRCEANNDGSDYDRSCHCPLVPPKLCRSRAWASALCPASSSSFRDGEPLAAFKVVAERVRALATCYSKLALLPPPPGYAARAEGAPPRADFTIKRAVEMHRRRLELTVPERCPSGYNYGEGSACLHEPGQKVDTEEGRSSYFEDRIPKYSLRHLHDVCNNIWEAIDVFKDIPGEEWESWAVEHRMTVGQWAASRLLQRNILVGEKKQDPESKRDKGWPSTCGGWIDEYDRLKLVLKMFPALVQLVEPDGCVEVDDKGVEKKWTGAGDFVVVPAEGTEEQWRTQRRAGREFSRGIEEHFNMAITDQIEQLQGLAEESQGRLSTLEDTDEEDEETGTKQAF
jgi:hypothetical protein